VFIHAGVVAWNNHALIFPGSSHAGKSHLVWSLVQAGAVYYSDEFAVLDRFGYVHPFEVPIGMRSEDGTRHMVMPGRIGQESLVPAVIVFARYRPGAKWRPQVLGPAETMMSLIRQSVAIRRHPALVLPVLKHISLRARSVFGTRGGVTEVLDWISSLDLQS
jgi:hypothetical protein